MTRVIGRLVWAACVAGLLLVPRVSVAQAPREVAQLSAALLEFEAAVKWDVVSQKWRAQREPWVVSVRKADTPADVAHDVAALEAAMTWESVQDSFRKRRDGWSRELTTAKSTAQVARLLLELEEATKWEAVSDSWRQARSGWVSRVERLSR